jgi:hypothetical protein
MSASKKK